MEIQCTDFQDTDKQSTENRYTNKNTPNNNKAKKNSFQSVSPDLVDPLMTDGQKKESYSDVSEARYHMELALKKQSVTISGVTYRQPQLQEKFKSMTDDDLKLIMEQVNDEAGKTRIRNRGNYILKSILEYQRPMEEANAEGMDRYIAAFAKAHLKGQ